MHCAMKMIAFLFGWIRVFALELWNFGTGARNYMIYKAKSAKT